MKLDYTIELPQTYLTAQTSDFLFGSNILLTGQRNIGILGYRNIKQGENTVPYNKVTMWVHIGIKRDSANPIEQPRVLKSGELIFGIGYHSYAKVETDCNLVPTGKRKTWGYYMSYRGTELNKFMRGWTNVVVWQGDTEEFVLGCGHTGTSVHSCMYFNAQEPENEF